MNRINNTYTSNFFERTGFYINQLADYASDEYKFFNFFKVDNFLIQIYLFWFVVTILKETIKMKIVDLELYGIERISGKLGVYSNSNNLRIKSYLNSSFFSKISSGILFLDRFFIKKIESTLSNLIIVDLLIRLAYTNKENNKRSKIHGLRRNLYKLICCYKILLFIPVLSAKYEKSKDNPLENRKNILKTSYFVLQVTVNFFDPFLRGEVSDQSTINYLPSFLRSISGYISNLFCILNNSQNNFFLKVYKYLELSILLDYDYELKITPDIHLLETYSYIRSIVSNMRSNRFNSKKEEVNYQIRKMVYDRIVFCIEPSKECNKDVEKVKDYFYFILPIYLIKKSILIYSFFSFIISLSKSYSYRFIRLRKIFNLSLKTNRLNHHISYLLVSYVLSFISYLSEGLTTTILKNTETGIENKIFILEEYLCRTILKLVLSYLFCYFLLTTYLYTYYFFLGGGLYENLDLESEISKIYYYQKKGCYPIGLHDRSNYTMDILTKVIEESKLIVTNKIHSFVVGNNQEIIETTYSYASLYDNLKNN